MVELDLNPSPDKGKNYQTSTWQNFLKLHMNTIVACDFFSKEIYTLTGKHTAFCLAFIHLGSRKVWCSYPTYHPNAQWVKQQARNVMMWLEDNNIKMEHLIRDGDGKFQGGFDPIIGSGGTEIIKTPVRAPNANAYMECWIGSLKKECLNHFMCVGRKHFSHIVDHYVDFYNDHRPHQGKDNQLLKFENYKIDQPSEPPAATDDPNAPLGKIKYKNSLGGLLKHYYRDAA